MHLLTILAAVGKKVPAKVIKVEAPNQKPGRKSNTTEVKEDVVAEAVDIRNPAEVKEVVVLDEIPRVIGDYVS